MVEDMMKTMTKRLFFTFGETNLCGYVLGDPMFVILFFLIRLICTGGLKKMRTVSLFMPSYSD